jgi:hypothetical protein
MRDSVRSDLLRDAVLDRVILIAKGEAPTLEASANEASVEAEVQPSQPQDEVDEATSDNTEESV